jgi:hypothetical protein
VHRTFGNESRDQELYFEYKPGVDLVYWTIGNLIRVCVGSVQIRHSQCTDYVWEQTRYRKGADLMQIRQTDEEYSIYHDNQ